MNKKIVVMSDTHLASRYPFSQNPHPYHDPFFIASYKGGKQPIDYAIKNKLDIIHGADLFDNDVIRAPEYSVATSLFDKIQKSGIRMFLNLGNHEISYKEGVPSVLQSLASKYKNITTPHYKNKWEMVMWYDLHIYMIPYYLEGEFNEVLNELCENVKLPAILVIHQNIKGIQLGKAKLNEGLNQQELMYKVKDKFKLIICGHLHFSNLIGGCPQILISGSTCSMDFKDLEDVKSFNIVEFDDNYNVNKIYREFIKDQIRFTGLIVDHDLEEELQRDYKNCFVQLDTTIQDDNEYIEKELLKKGAIGVRINAIDGERHKADLSDYARPTEMSIDDWLNIWLKDKIEDDEMIEPVLELNKEIFNERKRQAATAV